MCMLIALFVLTTVTTLANGEDTSNMFDCYPNQTIRFTNPDSGVYTHFKAFYELDGNATNCNVTTADGNSYAYMDCASTTATVTLYISEGSLAEGDNMQDSNTYMFACGVHNAHHVNAGDTPSEDQEVLDKMTPVDSSVVMDLNTERKQDALFKEAMEDQQCRATELEELKTRMIGWFDMIHTESREEKHRPHDSHFDQLSMFHKKKGHNLGKPELGQRDRSESHHDKQSMYPRKRDRNAPHAFSAGRKGDHLDKKSMYHRKRDGIADATEEGHLDQQSMFHAKRDKTDRVPVAFGPQTADHVNKQSVYHRKRGIVENESYDGCTCSKSVMLEFRKQDTSGDGHLTEDEISVMSANRREPCMKHLIKSCDTHDKHDKYLKLAGGEWCCCFQEIVAPCFEKKKHSNPDEWIPSCDDEGYFEREQRHKDGSSWCVDINGNMIEGTKTKQGNADCKNFGPSGYPVKP